MKKVFWANVSSPAHSPPLGYESGGPNPIVVVSAVNMCSGGNFKEGCYSKPNRIGLSLACGTSENSPLSFNFCGLDFKTFSSCKLSKNSTIEITVNLNSFSSSLQWSWIDAKLLYWNTTTNSNNQTIITIRLNPVEAPHVDMSNLKLPQGVMQCCTCDFPANCPIMHSFGYSLGFKMFFHVEGSGVSQAVFVTENAVMGAIARSIDSDGNPSLEYRLVSSHFQPDGVSLLLGRMVAFIPWATLSSMFPKIPNLDSAYKALNISRVSDGGSQGTIEFQVWNADDNGSDGIAIIITGVTFSTPSYKLTVTDSYNSLKAVNGGNTKTGDSSVQEPFFALLLISLLFCLKL